MTAKEIYEIGISYIPEIPSDNPDLQRYVVGWLNTMMLETFEVENAIRTWNKEELLIAPQIIKNINES